MVSLKLANKKTRPGDHIRVGSLVFKTCHYEWTLRCQRLLSALFTVLYKTLPIVSLARGRSQRPAGYAKRPKTGVEWHPSAVNGNRQRGSFATAGRGRARTLRWLISHTENRGLFAGFEECLLVYHRPQHGDREMRELRCAFVQLQPPHRTVLLQIARHTEFGDAQVFRHPRF